MHHFPSFLQSLLDEPNPDSPANIEAANLFQTDKHEYAVRVRRVVMASWMDESVPASMEEKDE